MSTLTLIVNNKGFLSYKTECEPLELVGEFFVKDISYMPAFARALLAEPREHIFEFKVCRLFMHMEHCGLQPLASSNTNIVVLSRSILFDIVQLWEQTVVQAPKNYFVKNLTCADIAYKILDQQHTKQSMVFADLAK